MRRGWADWQAMSAQRCRGEEPTEQSAKWDLRWAKRMLTRALKSLASVSSASRRWPWLRRQSFLLRSRAPLSVPWVPWVVGVPWVLLVCERLDAARAKHR